MKKRDIFCTKTATEISELLKVRSLELKQIFSGDDVDAPKLNPFDVASGIVAFFNNLSERNIINKETRLIENCRETISNLDAVLNCANSDAQLLTARQNVAHVRNELTRFVGAPVNFAVK